MEKFDIPISKPDLSKQDFLEIKKCFDSTWISSKSPWVEKFEKSFAKKISGTKYSVGVNSGTSALFLALKSLGIGVGDEIILPTLTMIATINAITWVGATPVLVDSTSQNDWNIDPKKIKEKITNKTKAILPVHLYGYPCDMDEINKIAKEHKLYVIGDVAEAMGTLYKNKSVGNCNDISCYSLYSNKIITTGNGGMVCTNDQNIYHLIKKLSFFDFNETTHFKHNLIGYNLVLSGLQAALGYSQAKRFKKYINKRIQVFSWYKENFKNEQVKLIISAKENSPNYWFPAVLFKDKNTKKRIVDYLSKNRVETRDFFLPIHLQPVYKNFFKKQKYPISEYFFERGLLLPSYFKITKNQVKFICNLILKKIK
ncbi:MAG: Perosamine synthetase [Candidatus Shapirobacteria bacterium GW2011_GWE1_38_10]|uniref:Perosamine synthetase n=1 Tax=Candidatus Shapirobacteria bacterium GW2011_GWE1_38_10 TaxID=1618488 RepID=A0A0G0KME9_9BACT|nr:MAG: Perosamine synthetase [Candidatus Shapirobacteria bacterium GW2011_GWF2_37_20]KKQ50374.1 MAG: Perosamine synthetase [Candidatus Shapirobacteria bacterium GW2011_GWE1_38_10]KKQ65198.1 MAG: Perosamine synthetase [Candidatus Shapirobacteria bacterium GW2011_GWF1_38_23]